MTTHAITPHTRIDNSIIDDLAAKIGIYGLGIYVAIKRHLNQKTGDCFPSYKTIARKLGIDRFHFPVAAAMLLLVAESLIGTRRRTS